MGGIEQTLKEAETPRKRLRSESRSSKSPPGKRRSLKGKEQSSGSEFSAKDITEDDLIVEKFSVEEIFPANSLPPKPEEGNPNPATDDKVDNHGDFSEDDEEEEEVECKNVKC